MAGRPLCAPCRDKQLRGMQVGRRRPPRTVVIAAALIGAALGSTAGFFGGIYGRVLYMNVTNRSYDRGMDLAAAFFGLAAIPGAGLGWWLGVLLVKRWGWYTRREGA